MAKQEWYDSENPSTVVRGGTVRVMLWIGVVVVFFGVLGGAIWGVRVMTSDTAGKGNAVIQKNDANNRIAAQQRFEQLYQDIVASDRKITAAQQAVDAAPNDKTAQQNLTGTINYCISVVGDYNALTRSYTAEDFRAIDLPAQIDNSDPTTDCK